MSRLHLIGFPHTALDDPDYATCAYTQKIRKFRDMGWGDRLVTYHADGSSLPPAVPGVPPAWPGPDEWGPFNEHVVNRLRGDAERGDVLLLAGGASQLPVALAFPHLLACEPGVGYEGVCTNHCAFESYAWQHHVYGLRRWDGRAFDTVIPNYFDPDEFPHVNGGGGDYAVFIGRVVQRKGPHVAADIARRAGLPLKVAGPGPTEWGNGKIVAPEVTIEGDHVEYVGVVHPDERAELLAGAACVIVPTLYVEPFGGVAVEAMMCGTPVVASDWGAFTETVETGLTGYRFRTLAEGSAAVADAMLLAHGGIRERAIERFSLDAVKPLYARWFDTLDTLWGDGYYAASTG